MAIGNRVPKQPRGWPGKHGQGTIDRVQRTFGRQFTTHRPAKCRLDGIVCFNFVNIVRFIGEKPAPESVDDIAFTGVFVGFQFLTGVAKRCETRV